MLSADSATRHTVLAPAPAREMRAEMFLHILHCRVKDVHNVDDGVVLPLSQLQTRRQSRVTCEGLALCRQTCSLHSPEFPLHQKLVPTLDSLTAREAREIT